MTEKGKVFKNKKNRTFLLGNAELLEITGIAENSEKGSAIVRYKYKWSPTPFYELRKDNESCSVLPSEDEVEFIKFDTGWQVKK
ncbi:hypothetical protein [Flavivirga jejuensis]|uniref:Uncharacterized protein n=1 Tax=Flavivirga jejuensis TaxID=870487 RepID=A0ABT8WL32_9FLAO|nr:hypothetical protein [Flavivirga jejuensis]MDO5973865.1 hypothetical protein [Flavivirga jejuensis]